MLLSVGELKYWGATTTYGKGIVPVTEGATSGPLPQLGRSLGRLITSPFVSLSSKNAPRTWEAPPKLSAPPWRNCSPVLPKAMKTIQVQRLLALAASLPPPPGWPKGGHCLTGHLTSRFWPTQGATDLQR